MDKKKIIALAAGTLVAGVFSSQGLQAMTDYCDYGSGSDIRAQMLEDESAAPVSVDEALAGHNCRGGKCPRPQRPQKKGTNKQARGSKSSAGSCGEGSCGEGSCGNKTKRNKGKSPDWSCGEGTCG